VHGRIGTREVYVSHTVGLNTAPLIIEETTHQRFAVDQRHLQCRIGGNRPKPVDGGSKHQFQCGASLNGNVRGGAHQRNRSVHGRRRDQLAFDIESTTRNHQRLWIKFSVGPGHPDADV
jgi:hypothetical protein